MNSKIILQIVPIRWLEFYFYGVIKRLGNRAATIDANGNTVQIIDDRGGTTTYVYDQLDRLIQVIQHDGSTRTNVYNAASNITQMTDENGSVFYNTFDALGRKTVVSIYPAEGIGGTTYQAFQYDGLSRMTYSDATFSEMVLHFYYDSSNRQVEEEQVDTYSNRYSVTQSAFTSRMASQLTYPNDRQVNSVYDVLYRRNQAIETSTSASIAQWNFIGQRPVEVLLGNGVIQTMLSNSRNHSMVQTDVPNPAWGTANSDRLGFDGSSRLIGKRYLAGGINGTSFAYNDTTPVVGFTTQYDLAGNKMYERELHAETRSHLYQPFDSDGNPLGGYDSVDRLRKALRGELSSSGGYTESGGGSITTPISLPDTNTSRTYELDGLGNWVESDYVPVDGTLTTDARQHNKLNEILNRKIDDVAKVLFTYDNNGNLTNDGTLSYYYDALNRLIQVNRVSDGQPIGYYSYDALNRRLNKIITNGGSTGSIPNGTTQFLYLQWQVVEEGNESYYEYPTKQYVWGQYIDECIQMKTLTTTGPQSLPAGDYYPLQDLLYRTTALTNSSGSIVEAYDYDAYGNTLIFKAAGTGGNWWADNAVQANYGACDVLYCGYRYDPELQTYQVRNREYSPMLGRWLQRDPIGFDGGDWNLYGYVGENPVKMMDSFGEDPMGSSPDNPYPFSPPSGQGGWYQPPSGQPPIYEPTPPPPQKAPPPDYTAFNAGISIPFLPGFSFQGQRVEDKFGQTYWGFGLGAGISPVISASYVYGDIFDMPHNTPGDLAAFIKSHSANFSGGVGVGLGITGSKNLNLSYSGSSEEYGFYSPQLSASWLYDWGPYGGKNNRGHCPKTHEQKGHNNKPKKLKK